MKSKDDRIGSPLVCVFLCDQLPSEIPAWIRIEPRFAEPGYYCQFDWHTLYLQSQVAQSVELIVQLPAYLASLGFEGVDAVEWRTTEV